MFFRVADKVQVVVVPLLHCETVLPCHLAYQALQQKSFLLDGSLFCYIWTYPEKSTFCGNFSSASPPAVLDADCGEFGLRACVCSL